MAGSITHTTAADATFSATGATEWNRGHTFSLAASDLSDTKTGSGNLVLATAPTLTTPIIGSYTFATLPSAAANSGATARVTDIGATTAGSLWISNGTIWKPVNGRAVIVSNAAQFTANAAGGEVKSNLNFTFPAAFFNVNDRLRFRCTLSKAGATTVGTLLVRIGTDASVPTNNVSVFAQYNAMNAANRSGGFELEILFTAATTVRQLGTSPATNGVGSWGGSNATVLPGAATITNVSNSLLVEVNIVPGATDNVLMEDGTMEYYSA